MSVQPITLEEGKAILRKVMEENPDRVNPLDEYHDACLYNGPNGTHCVAGTAFIALGVDPRDLEESEGDSASEAGQRVGLWTDRESPVADLFGRVQALADQQQPIDHRRPARWGDVLTHAREEGLL